MEIEKNNASNQIARLRVEPQTSFNAEWRTAQFLGLGEAYRQSLTAELLAIYVEATADLSDNQIKQAIGRAIQEKDYFPRVSELRKLAGADQAERQDAEGRAAWETLEKFVSKYVSNDIYGNYGPEHGWYTEWPTLSDRILATVRRTGSWKVYACMTDEDFPFVQKRFFDEYKAWTAVEKVDLRKLIQEMPRLQLAAKTMDPANRNAESCGQGEAKKTRGRARTIVEPLSDEQLRDRREMLRQQAAQLSNAGSR